MERNSRLGGRVGARHLILMQPAEIPGMHSNHYQDLEVSDPEILCAERKSIWASCSGRYHTSADVAEASI